MLFRNVFPATRSGKADLVSPYLEEKYGARLPAYQALESAYPLALISPHPRFSFHTMGDAKGTWLNEVEEHRVLHEERFFELAGTVTVEVEFSVTDDEARQLLELESAEPLRLFYARIPAHFGVIGGPAAG